MGRGSKRSYTAEGAAALRAAGTREADPALRNPDRLAERFIGWRWRVRLLWTPLRAVHLRMAERLVPGVYRFVTARTKHFDEVFLAEVRSGVTQVIILGAGADSRPYRFGSELGAVRVFELDHPATSAWKRRRTRRVLGELPEHVRYVAVDLDRVPLDAVLDSAGVRRAARTLFVCEGVTPYLTGEAVDAILAAVSRFATGSSIVFDYLYRDAMGDRSGDPEDPAFVRYLRRRGEPVRFGLDPDGLADFLAARGLTLESSAGPEELARRHLGGAYPVIGFSAIAQARAVGGRP